MLEDLATWKHLLHVDFALLEEIGDPLAVFKLGRLLQAEQKQGEMGAVLQWVSQLGHAHQLGNDGTSYKLGQVGFHQGHVLLDLGALVQDVEESLRRGDATPLFPSASRSWQRFGVKGQSVPA